MDVVLLEGIGAILRWLHVIAGIAWIGSSFYFIHLDLSLKPRPESKDRDSDGEPQREAWQVHGGGFYNMVKYVVAPARLPAELTWFKWEAYVTWLSGMALLAVVYYLGASLFLIDATVLDLTQGEAVAISLAGLLVPWLAYEGLCRSPLGRHELALSLLGYAFLIALTYGFVHVFGGRGAFVQIGALIGTIMVANVFVVIIPNQRKIVAGLVAAGGLAAALSTADGLLLAIANALSHDIYYKMVDPKADSKRRLIVARVLLVFVAVIAAWLASTKPSDILSMVAWAFSIAASGLFAPLVLGVWWKRATSAGAVCGMIAGFGVCMFYLVGTQYGGMQTWFGVRNISAGLFGIPAAFVVTWVVSLLTPAPSKDMQDFVDSIRVPRGGPVMQEN